MFRRPRYFKNSLPDYSVSTEKINTDFVLDLINIYVEQIEDNFKPTLQNANGGLYVGAPGVAFMFLKLSSCKCFQEKRKEFLEKALSYVRVNCLMSSKCLVLTGDFYYQQETFFIQ